MSREVRLTVNGREETLRVGDHEILLDVLREQLRLFSVREGCGVGLCGACTVLVDGAPISSCLALAARLEGRVVTTVEGVGTEQALHPVQAAFIEAGALQCGYCTPGLVLSVAALLDETPAPSPEAVLGHLSGNLCRCCAYPDIVRAVAIASEKLAAAGVAGQMLRTVGRG
jgi:aerobic-type carbon monoxide dehydrogenase small subunit (CoxS/CutS family)